MEVNKRGVAASIVRWFDAYAGAGEEPVAGARRFDWTRLLPFVALHLGCLGVIWTGTSVFAVLVAVALYALRMFAITGFYHRYFAHCAFRTSRAAQFVFAVIGAAAVQRGPLWWASHHRHHHASSDTPADAHSSLQHGFLWSHMGWFLARENFAPRSTLVADLARYPELRFLDRFDVLVPLLLAAALYAAGEWLGRPRRRWRPAARNWWCGAFAFPPWSCIRPPSPSTRCRIASGAAATPPAMIRATTRGWPC